MFETSKKEKTILTQKIAIEKLESKRKTYLIFGIIIFFLTFGLVYYKMQKNRRARLILAAQVEQNEVDLNNFTMQLLQKSQEQESLSKELIKLKSVFGEKEELLELNGLMDSKILTKEDWLTFKEKFNKTYPNFFINLKMKEFKFTEAEYRLLALETLQLKNNEIAKMLGISARSVITTRSRLKKKISPPNGLSILEYLKKTA